MKKVLLALLVLALSGCGVKLDQLNMFKVTMAAKYCTDRGLRVRVVSLNGWGKIEAVHCTEDTGWTRYRDVELYYMEKSL